MAATVINVDFGDSLGQGFTGYLRVTLDSPLTTEGAQQNLEITAEVPLVSGAATLALAPSEVEGVLYLFEVVRVAAGVPTVVRSFRAAVPVSSTTVNLSDLSEQTGIYQDNQDGAIAAVTRRLYSDPSFWQAMRANLFSQEGAWSATVYYRAGQVVFWQGGSYVCTSLAPIVGIVPSDTSKWQQWSSVGATGSGSTGSLIPYSASGWNGNSQAVAQGAIRELVENQLAPKSSVDSKLAAANGTADGLSISNDYPLTENSSKAVRASWVQANLTAIRAALLPVGSVIDFAGSSAPTGFLFCDGRTVSRTAYAALFAILGTDWNTGGEAGTDFRLPDYRGRFRIGSDIMSSLRGAASVVPSATRGAIGGARQAALGTANLPPHSHPLIQAAVSNGSGGGTTATGANSFSLQSNTGLSTGTATPFDILPPYLPCHVIIYAGV